VGSDVGSLQTTAVKSEDGKYWIVNGSKNWVTGSLRRLGPRSSKDLQNLEQGHLDHNGRPLFRMYLSEKDE